MRKILYLFIVTTFVALFASSASWAAVLNVPSTYTTIQDAINAASTGDTINIAAGTYSVDTTIIVNKGVTISGPTTGGAIVEGTNVNAVSIFEIKASNVTIQSLEIRVTSIFPGYPIVESLSSLVRIPDNLALTGITITGNTLCVPVQVGAMSTWVARAIYVGSSNTGISITGNTIHNTRNGVVARYNSAANISNNVIYDTKGGIMNYTNSQADADNRLMSNNSWGTTHNEWDIVWNSGGAPYPPDYNKSVLMLSGANNEAYVLSLIPTYSSPTGNRSHIFVNATTGVFTTHPANGNKNLPYATVALGIEAVVPGGTIYVAAGTYMGPINITKSLSLKGAGNGLNVMDREAASDTEATITGLVTVTASDVNINGFTLTNPGQTYALLVKNAIQNINITYNIVDNVGNDTMVSTVHAINVYRGPDSVIIAHNRFNNIKAYLKSANAIGVLDSASTNPSTGLLIEDNSFTNISSVRGAYGVIINNKAGAPGAQIRNNTFALLKGGWTHAIGLEGPTPDAVVTGNIFSGLTTQSGSPDNAAILFQANPVGNTVTVSQNKFDGTGFFGVAIHPDDITAYNYTVNAENNWWGAANGPAPYGNGALVGQNVTFIPWLSSSDGTVGDVCSGAALEIRWLIEDVQGINLKKSKEKKIIHELDKSLKEAVKCDREHAIKGVEKFIKEVQKKKLDKYLTEAEEAALVASANEILALLGGL